MRDCHHTASKWAPIAAEEDGFDGIEPVVEIQSRLEGLQMGNVGSGRLSTRAAC